VNIAELRAGYKPAPTTPHGLPRTRSVSSCGCVGYGGSVFTAFPPSVGTGRCDKGEYRQEDFGKYF
jgi:hypothetical protein